MIREFALSIFQGGIAVWLVLMLALALFVARRFRRDEIEHQKRMREICPHEHGTNTEDDTDA